ncbi:hypothetical protein Tco_0706428 [Tanacetum coccineum]|uniref:Uncharacterized protein n=1 Tax=Tanacetum coccineum TaxID=301880 RepID=A0ABQ4Y9K3_9ASTR
MLSRKLNSGLRCQDKAKLSANVKDSQEKHDSDDDEDDDDDEGPSAGSNQSDPESEHSEQSSDDISKQDKGDGSDMEDTDNAHIPKVSTTTWFKPIPESERPATPEPEWTIPPNDFPEPEHNWANAITPQRLKFRRKTSFKGRHMILGRSSNGSADEQERRSSAKLTCRSVPSQYPKKSSSTAQDRQDYPSHCRQHVANKPGYRKDGDGDGNSQPHKVVKASANSDVKYSFTSAQDGEPLQDDVRLCLGDDLKKAQDHSQRHV